MLHFKTLLTFASSTQSTHDLIDVYWKGFHSYLQLDQFESAANITPNSYTECSVHKGNQIQLTRYHRIP